MIFQSGVSETTWTIPFCKFCIPCVILWIHTRKNFQISSLINILFASRLNSFVKLWSVTHRWKDNNSLDIRLYLESRPGICCAFRFYINYFGSINSFLSCEDKKIIKSTKSQVRNIFQNICPIIKNKIQSTEGRLKCAECHPWRGEAGGEVQFSSQSI